MEQNDQATGSWMDSLQSDELKSSEALKQFNDLDSLAKGYQDLKAYQGQSLRIPGEDAGDDQYNEFYNKVVEKVPNLMVKPDFNDETLSTAFYRSLGMPEAPDGYEPPEVEGVEIAEDRINSLKEVAHKQGLTGKQFKGFMEEALKMDAEANVAVQESIQAGMDELRQELGFAFKDGVEQAEKVRDAFFNFIDPKMMDAQMTKAFMSIGKQLGKEALNVHGQSTQEVVNTPELARDKINEINMNSEHPYWIAGHPDHQAAVQKMLKLMEEANPPAAA